MVDPLLAIEIAKQLGFEMRWAQLRHLRCGGCRATYWALVGERITVSTWEFRSSKSSEPLRHQADEVLRRRAALRASDPSFGFAPCPHCGWLPAATAHWTWRRSIVVGSLAGVVPAILGSIYLGMVVLYDQPVAVQWTVAVCAGVALVAGVVWLVHALLPSLSRRISPRQFPTADEAWFRQLLADCGPTAAPEQVWYESIPGESEPRDGWALLPPEDWTNDGRIDTKPTETPPPFTP